MAEKIDIIVVGAGLSGLAFASFYLEIHPTAELVIVDEAPGVGGVWSASRMFDSFWTQSSVSLSGFSRPPFQLPHGVTNKYNLYHSSYVTDYLEKFVTYHQFEGRTLRDRIRFERHVSSISRQTGTDLKGCWRVECTGAADGERKGSKEVLEARKLAIATGRTSIPYIPNLPSKDTFSGRIIHHKDYGDFRRAEDLRAKDAIDEISKNIVVLGAGKSAADLVYDSIKRGGSQVNVSWLIRKHGGEGPAIFLPAADPHYDNSLTRSMIRWTNLFSPSSFMSAWQWPIVCLIHGTSWGLSFLREKRAKARAGCVALGGYEDREGALPGFHLLRPDEAHSPFWCTGPLGLTQHDDFWDLIARKVHIYRNDLSELVKNGILLDDGKVVSADLILCGTGWRAEYPFLAPDLQTQLGLPRGQDIGQDESTGGKQNLQHNEDQESSVETSRQNEEADSQKLWKILLDDADRKVLYHFPTLAEPPLGFRQPPESTTARLYNCMVPLADMYPADAGEGRSIVFLGHCDTASSFRVAEAQGIWATAYLDGSFQLPNVGQARKEVAYMNAFSRRRYPSKGRGGDSIFFEALWYTDKLMDDLGLVSHWSHRSWWANWTEPVAMADFKDMPNEYRKRFMAEEK